MLYSKWKPLAEPVHIVQCSSASMHEYSASKCVESRLPHLSSCSDASHQLPDGAMLCGSIKARRRQEITP